MSGGVLPKRDVMCFLPTGGKNLAIISASKHSNSYIDMPKSSSTSMGSGGSVGSWSGLSSTAMIRGVGPKTQTTRRSQIGDEKCKSSKKSGKKEDRKKRDEEVCYEKEYVGNILRCTRG